MESQFSRTEILLGKQSMEKLSKSNIAIFGIGGVGSYAIEALVRVGIQKISIFDNDIVSISNINRQLIATLNTLNKKKVDVAKERVLEINKNIEINCFDWFVSEDNINDINFYDYDYIIDAIDTIKSKILIIEKSKEYSVPIISSMGAGNKLNPTDFMVADIYETSVCPLAKIIRKECRIRNIENLKVVYSKEKPIKTNNENFSKLNSDIGSISFVPSVAGLIIASEVVKDII